MLPIQNIIISLTKKNFRPIIRKMIEKFNRLSESLINHSYRSYGDRPDRACSNTCRRRKDENRRGGGGGKKERKD